MIPKIRALAIDDEQDHLDDIVSVVTKLGIGCLPLLHPRDTASLPTEHFESIRLVFTDLHLGAAEAMSNNQAQYKQVAGLLLSLDLKNHCPYILIVWTSYPDEVVELTKVIEERFPPARMPLTILALDKLKYGVGVPDSAKDKSLLLADIKEMIENCKALHALLLWERDVLLAADNASRKIVEIARKNAVSERISIEGELDQLLSLIAIHAASVKEAQNSPRTAVMEGLSALLLDELQHLEPVAENDAIWKAALTRLDKPKELKPTENQIYSLNNALLISQTKSNGSMRGSVLNNWFVNGAFSSQFGVSISEMWERFGFLEKPATNNIVWRLVQIEGICDSVQNKPGVVPMVLAAEVDAITALKPIGVGNATFRPQSVVETPAFDHDGKAKKLIVCFRFFLTIDRKEAKNKSSEYRLREPLINWVASSWATYLTRPGYISI